MFLTQQMFKNIFSEKAYAIFESIGCRVDTCSDLGGTVQKFMKVGIVCLGEEHFELENIIKA